MNFDALAGRRIDPSRRRAAASGGETMNLLILYHCQFQVVVERCFRNLLPLTYAHVAVSGGCSSSIGLMCMINLASSQQCVLDSDQSSPPISKLRWLCSEARIAITVAITFFRFEGGDVGSTNTFVLVPAN
ncbi:MAG: hypothetical protein ACTHM2_01165 [Afipia sp.]